MSDPSRRPWLTFRVVVPFSIQSMHTHIHNWLSGTITDLPLWHFFIFKFSLCPSNKNPARRTLWFYFCRCVSHCLLVVFLSFDSISLAIDSLLCCVVKTEHETQGGQINSSRHEKSARTTNQVQHLFLAHWQRWARVTTTKNMIGSWLEWSENSGLLRRRVKMESFFFSLYFIYSSSRSSWLYKDIFFQRELSHKADRGSATQFVVVVVSTVKRICAHSVEPLDPLTSSPAR